MPIKTFDEVRAHLLALGEGTINPKNPRHGVCVEVNQLGWGLRKMAYRHWPGFTGDWVYPVPHPHKNDPCVAYDEGRPRDMWMEGGYAENRRNLCVWLARNLKPEHLMSLGEWEED